MVPLVPLPHDELVLRHLLDDERVPSTAGVKLELCDRPAGRHRPGDELHAEVGQRLSHALWGWPLRRVGLACLLGEVEPPESAPRAMALAPCAVVEAGGTPWISIVERSHG